MCATPAAAVPAPGGATSWHSPKPATPDRNLVLLAEDDDFVSALIERILARSGWQVLRVEEGAECIRLLRKHGSNVALAILDGGLPDTDGASLCRELRAISPELKILLTSGRKESCVAGAPSETAHTAFMPKPFTPSDLERHVSAVLGIVS